MTRLRPLGATARQARLRPFGASALRPFESLRVAPSNVEGRQAQGRPEQRRGTARQARLPSFAATARQAFATGVAVLIFGSSTVLACPVCFGAEETPMIDGAKLGVLALLAITLAVQGGFVGFFFYLRKRMKRIADIELDAEWSQLQGGASRT